MKKRIAIVLNVVLFVCFLSGSALAKDPFDMQDIINFTPEQVTALADTAKEHKTKMQGIIGKLEKTVEDLLTEANKNEGSDVPNKLRKNPKKIDKLIREIASLTGDILKAKTEYLLKAKDVLSDEQKQKLIADLEYRVDFVDRGTPFLFQLDDLADILDLSTDQVKSVLKYRTDMRINELKLQMDVAMQVLDIRDIIKTAKSNPKTIDSKVMKIADIGAKLLNNRIDYLLKARKVLTEPQRQELRHLIMLNLHAFSLFN